MNKYLIIIISTLFTLFVSCKEKNIPATHQQEAFKISDSMMRMISIDSADTGYIDETLTLSGEVVFNDNHVSKIFPRSSGQVISCKLSLGDKVHKGQVLAVLKSAEVAGSYADLTGANADILIAKRQLDNTESLFANGIASERDLTEARQQYQKALAAKERIQSSISINGGTGTAAGGTYTLVSPIDGYVVEKKVTEGSFVRTDMADQLFTISDLRSVWVLANVFEADIPRVKEGMPVQITTLAYPDKVYKGTIEKTGDMLDPINKVMHIRISLPNNDLLLRPEMFAKVVVNQRSSKLAVKIPTSSLVNLNGKNYVVVFNTPTDVQIREVEVINTNGIDTYIRSGLTGNERLIVKNQLLIFQELLNR